MVWLLFCMLVEEFSNIQLCFNMHESIVFSPAALSNLANLCYLYVCRPIRTCRGGWPLTLTGIFGTLGRLWVVGTDLKCLWSHRAGTQASGWVSPLPWPPAPSIVIPLAPARPFIPAHTRHPTPAGPIGNYCRNKSESRSRRRRTGGRLVCSVTSCWHGVRWSDTELNHAVWEQSGPGSLTSVTLSQTSGRDTGCLCLCSVNVCVWEKAGEAASKTGGWGLWGGTSISKRYRSAKRCCLYNRRKVFDEIAWKMLAQALWWMVQSSACCRCCCWGWRLTVAAAECERKAQRGYGVWKI